MSDEIMCINKDEILYLWARVLTCKRFVNVVSVMVVQGSFYVGVYKYSRPDSLSGSIVVFKVPCGESYERQSFIEAIADASHKAPIFL